MEVLGSSGTLDHLQITLEDLFSYTVSPVTIYMIHVIIY